VATFPNDERRALLLYVDKNFVDVRHPTPTPPATIRDPVEVDVEQVVPPTYKLLAIPIPPAVIIEPVVVDVESVVPRAITVSKLPDIPPYTLFPIPTPPPTVTAPVDVDVESTVPVIAK
jgi:hypothetical protein